MRYELRWSPDALDHFGWLARHEVVRVLDETPQQLSHQPNVPHRNRKLLRENPVAEWELRLGDLLVYYNVQPDEPVVDIIAVGVKRQNQVFVGGEEWKLS